MITLFRSDKIQPLSDIKNYLQNLLTELPDRIRPTGNPLGFFRYEFPCEHIDILTWLHNQNTEEKIYWSSRDKNLEIGGIAAAEILSGQKVHAYKEVFHHIEDRLSADNPSLRYFGGFSFDEKTWEPFGAYYFLVPQFELTRNHQKLTFAMNICINKINHVDLQPARNTLKGLNFDLTTQYRSVPVIKNRKDNPDLNEWKKTFKTIQEKLSAREIEKIVLARESSFTFDKYIDPAALIKHLKDNTENCYHFCLQPSSKIGFLGATPERLYERKGLAISSEALAGTKPRGSTELEDQQLEKDLLSSKKNAAEHQFVVNFIKNSMSTFCSKLEFDTSFSLLKFKEGQHLITRFRGLLKENIEDYQILEKLHPTPAVGGTPQSEALNTIKDFENFSRGFYAAPFGYIAYDHVEFAVGIRSGYIHHETLSLYAGAGIIRESTEKDEWDEIENKIQRFIKVFRNKH